MPHTPGTGIEGHPLLQIIGNYSLCLSCGPVVQHYCHGVSIYTQPHIYIGERVYNLINFILKFKFKDFMKTRGLSVDGYPKTIMSDQRSAAIS